MNTIQSLVISTGAQASGFFKNNLVAACLAVAVVGGAQAASLVSNGDFEAAVKDPTWADDWSRPKVGDCSWQAEAPGHFLRLKATAPGQTVMIYRIVKLPAEVKAVEISLRARITELKPGPQAWFDARIMTDFKNAAGAKIKGAKTITFRKNTEAWVERKVAFLVPEGATSLEIMPGLFQVETGTFDLDDLAVTAVDPATLPAPVVK
ncbi:MAG: hypothetical protein H7Y06_09300 [Opitutaceae bacterium]|nr:hypothetical protein [Opitutaceae bacterium]